MNQLITFQLANEIYGIEVTNVREILTYQRVTELPNTTNWVKGVINLRGEVTPIIDLRLRFATNKEPVYSDRTIVIAAKTRDMRMVGIVVDAVNDLENMQDAVLNATPDMGISIPNEYVRGLVKKGDDMIVVMDIEKLLDKKELEENQAGAGEHYWGS